MAVSAVARPESPVGGAAARSTSDGASCGEPLVARLHASAACDASKPDARNGSADDVAASRGNSNKFRCRVAMACVHCRHRKIRCDGAQPSCYTCTRLQRKCEYERVSEHDNLLSRERKRLSRERKAARLAVSSSTTSPPAHEMSPGAPEEKPSGLPMLAVRMQPAPNPTAPPVTLPLAAPSADVPPNAAAADPAAVIPPWTASAPTGGVGAEKDMMPWIVPPQFASPDATVNTTSLPAANDTLLSLRSTADPSLLELSAPTTISTDSPSLLAMPWLDNGAQHTPHELGDVQQLSDYSGQPLSVSTNALSSDASAVDGELTSAIDTPLKLFSDQQPPSAVATTPSPVESNTLSDTGSSGLCASMSMTMSPLSPQLAPPSFDGFPTDNPLDTQPIPGLDDPDCLAAGDSLGLYSSSLPANDNPSAFASDLEPSSLPILSSWTQLQSPRM
ncbi:hypothetical protein MSPP1_000947 [Malassezia sp. CBS 17886]|nr:hypothetical protein MSPP1_000947 [Malassezia sp. CBS 17886]